MIKTIEERALPPSTKDISPHCDVLIIGGGISGLTAASILQERGVNTMLVEAFDRLGGRIRSVMDTDNGDYIADLGPTWVWPEFQPVASRWLSELGLHTFAQFDSGDGIVDQDHESAPVRYDIPGQYGIRRVVGGSQAIVNALAARLPDTSVKLNTAVTSVTIHPEGCEIKTNNPVCTSVFAKQVIVSIPLRIAVGSIQWNPPLTAELEQAMSATPTWMAPQAKAVAVYDQPFWREKGISGRIASHVGPLVEAHDHSGPEGAPAAIFGFIGWSHNARNELGDGLQTEIIKQLTRCLGLEAAQPIHIEIEDWANNQWVCSPRDLSEPSGHPDVRPEILRRPHYDEKLFFAVAETSTLSPGLIEGAFDAGQTCAELMFQSK